ncbi:glycerate dehydrogenase [Halomonas chromatireducens]|uniref:Glycerate dehydrogenase n=2 Tax=Halomonas chromatireducens TaxID=507626 RepID=A0A0X8HDJ9_9GAMM|nr:glycerate dehydrogenase [Halomonas chromatireducens]
MIAPDDTSFAYLEGRPWAPEGERLEQAIRHWHPLLDALEESLNLIVTPHSAWITPEARQRIVTLTAENLRQVQAN